MKFSIAATLTLASVAYSQTIASEMAMIPACALTPLSNAITEAGCGLTDYVCQCGTAKSAITTAAGPSVLAACSTQDALTTQQITTEICNLVTGGSGSSSTAAASSAASSSVASSMASVTSSASSHASSHTSSASTSATHVSSSATSASSTAAVKTNAACSNLNAANFLAGMGFFAALAL